MLFLPVAAQIVSLSLLGAIAALLAFRLARHPRVLLACVTDADGTLQVVAHPLGGAGNPVGGASVTWKSSNPTVASVAASGLASLLTPGITTITATSTTNTSASGALQISVFGNGSCSLNPTGLVARSLKFTVQSDPGNHAAQIGFPTPPATLGGGLFDFTGTLNFSVGMQGNAPFVTVYGGWMNTGDCAFIANGVGTIGGQSNVGVQLKGTWVNGTLSLTYTVGTNGELSGGPTVYAVSN